MSIGGPRLEVFITGDSPGQVRFAEFVREMLGKRLVGADVGLTDVITDPERAELCGVIATPQLVRWHPSPVRRIIGEVYDLPSLLAHLELVGFDGA